LNGLTTGNLCWKKRGHGSCRITLSYS